jgi:hypothetical protein
VDKAGLSAVQWGHRWQAYQGVDDVQEATGFQQFLQGEVALEALKGLKTTSELAQQFKVHRTLTQEETAA